MRYARVLPGAATALLLLFISACGQRPQTKDLPAPPAIKSFTSDKTRLRAGESVTLSWTADHASGVELVDQTGSVIPTEGSASSGTATVSPAATSFYVLRVTGTGGGHSAFVQVAVEEDLKEVFLVAVPREVNAGESAQLLWSAFHATEAKLRTPGGVEQVLDVTAGSGLVEVKPERTQSYTLIATGTSAANALTVSTDVKVRPTILSFEANPQAAKPGEQITFTWKTRGAAEISVSESTFGALHTANLDEGSFTWTVPAKRPNGQDVLDTHPLRFTLNAKQTDPEITAVRELQGYVGEGPEIVQWDAPIAVTEGRPVTLRWRTKNATRLQVLSNGAPIYEPLARDAAEIAKGQLELAAVSGDTTFSVKVWSHLGAEASKQATVRVVKVPSITEFTLPLQVDSLGMVANASWKSTDASRVVIRTKHGPTVYATDVPATAAQGTTPLYPGQSTTFVLEAWNDAGDFDAEERAVIVAIPGELTASPSPITRGEHLDVNWSVPAGAVTQLLGDPRGAPTKTNPGNSFLDLASQAGARQVVFDHPDDDVQLLSLSKPFRFPFVGLVNERFWVSINGFVSFGQTESMPEEKDLATTADPLPPMIAPLWDDLRLGDGEVLYMVEGIQFPRRLIIQWDKVQTGAEGSELTFQVQLFETGEFRFSYKSLSGGDTGGESAAIGWYLQEGHGRNVALPAGGSLLAAGDELEWFVSTATDGRLEVVAERSGAFSLYGRLSGGNHVVFSAPVNVITPGSVRVNELMVLPEAHAALGKWVELTNVSVEPVDLSGTVLIAVRSDTSFTLPEGIVLQPGGFLVLGESMDPLENGDADVDRVWGPLQPDTASDDTLVLNASGEVSRLEYTSSQIAPGISIQPEESAIDRQNRAPTCGRVKTFGAYDALGTPGARNETCFLYVSAPIPVRYRDISASGTPLFDRAALSITNAFKNDIDLGGAPIPFYGQAQSKLHVSVNGFAAFEAITESFENYAMPGVNGSPVHIAVMWDRLEKRPSSDGNVFLQRFAAGEDPLTPAPHWIVQWHQLSHYEWGSANDDDLNFQVKFFDDGAIEYHYGTLRNGSGATQWADGRDATLWLESLDSSLALPLGRLQPVLQSNTAYRFTPNP